MDAAGPDGGRGSYRQVIKSKTAAGFVPNYAGGGAKSMDRTEPPVGSKALLQLFNKYQDKWVVELLFDDLLDCAHPLYCSARRSRRTRCGTHWCLVDAGSNWFMRRRVLPPLNLIALGSFNEEAEILGQFAPQNMQNARYESGLGTLQRGGAALLTDGFGK
jgi:hypothetical protein